MLVLSRREGEGIRIGPDVMVYVLRDRDGHVRLGIEAPRTVDIARVELDKRVVRDAGGKAR